MSNITIFGSTGTTGLCATEAALKAGHKVTVLVRDPEKVPDSIKNQLNIIKGNVLNYDDVLKAIKGASSVVVALGTRNDLKPTTELSDGLKNIVKAMKEENIDVISVCLSAFLFSDVFGDKMPPRFKDLTEEHNRMLDVLKESNLKYIAVFPPHIAEQPGTSYQAEPNKYLGHAVSKYDLGQFLVDSLNKPEFYGQIAGIVSKKA